MLKTLLEFVQYVSSLAPHANCLQASLNLYQSHDDPSPKQPSVSSQTHYSLFTVTQPTLTVIGGFAKACHITPLPKLPTAMETSKINFNAVCKH